MVAVVKTLIVEKRSITGAIILDLSFPPSTNNLFFNVKGRGRVISEDYKAWKDLAGKELMIQRPRCAVGPVHILILLQEPKTPCDLDNRIKALLDLCVAHGVIKTDCSKTVRSIFAKWDVGTIGARVEIRGAA